MNGSRKIAALSALIAVAALAFWWLRGTEPPRIEVQLTPGPSQPRVPATEAGFDPAALAQAAAYAEPRGTHALIVGRGGHIVFEKYWGGANFDTPVEVSGFTPALAAFGVGIALNDKLVKNLDAPLTNYLDADADGTMTLHQLLAHAPGEATAANGVARVLEKVSGQTFDVFLTERMWRIIEAGDFALAKARDGATRADCCLRARIGDLMRLGELLANDGVFEGNQLTPPTYVTNMLTAVDKKATHGFFTNVGGDFVARDVAWLGADDAQRLWVIPSLKLVILRVGAAPGSAGWDETMIPNTIIRGTSGWAPAQAGAGTDPNLFAPH